VTNDVPLDQTPIYIKSGTILPLAPQMQYTGELPWDPITLDVYPSASETSRVTLYEDDTVTTAYQHGAFRDTLITAAADDATRTVQVSIGAADGAFSGALVQRSWVLRIHPPMDWPENLVPTRVAVAGQKINAPIRTLARDATATPFGDKAGAPDAEVFEVNLPAASVFQNRQIEIAFGPPQNH